MTPRAQVTTVGPPPPAIQLLDPVGFEWTRVDLPVPNLPAALAGLKIVHLTDLHLYRRWWRALDDLIARVRDADPDLLLITGDFVDDKRDHSYAVPMVQRLLCRLGPARLGTFAVLGNHDSVRLAPHLAGTPVKLIDGDRTTVTRDGATVELIGLPGADRELLEQAWLDALPKRPANAVRVVLSHFPDQLLRIRQLEPDLVLAGHTHGGQCCLPTGRPIITHDSLPKRYSKGVHWMNGTWLVVGRGFGFASLRIRAFAPSQVIELRLQPHVARA